MTSRLEPQYADAFSAYQASPGPTTVGPLLEAATPMLRNFARKHIGDDGPIATGSARQAFLHALPRYDPARASLSTFAYQELQGLKRPEASAARGISVPARVAADRARIDEARESLTNEYGRDPDDDEVMDHARVSPLRYRRVMAYKPAVAQGTLDAAAGGTNLGGYEAQGIDDSTAYQQLVYAGLGGIDRKVMELAMGLNGRRPKSNLEIAQSLGLSPGAISQRKAKIQQMLDDTAGLTQELGV